MSNSQLVDIDPGGENTQYESTHTFIEAPAKQSGQLGAGEKNTRSQMKATAGRSSQKKGNEDMDMARRLESQGSDGGIRGEVDKDVKPEKQEGDDATAAKTRGQQKYGPGSGVGA